MANLTPLMSTGKDDWETPDDLFETYNQLFGFDLDAAANKTNHKLHKWFGPGGIVEDALSVDWLDYTAGPVWLNPPYSRGLQAKFVRKASEYRGDLTTVCLLPARTDTKLFHGWIWLPTNDVTFLRGRVKFKGASQGAPFPSMIVVIN